MSAPPPPTLATTLATTLALLALASSCSEHGSSRTAAPFTVGDDRVTLAPGAPQPVRFTSVAAERAAPLPPPPVTGRVTTVDAFTAPSFAPLDGRVAEMRVRLGDRVKQGDRLVLVRAADLATLRHEVDAARLAIKTKQTIVERTRQLVEARGASQNDLLVAESELSEAKLAAQAAAAKLSSLQVEQAGETSYWVLATRSGTVVQLDAAPGKQVGPDKDKPVATVADLDEVLVVGDVPQRDALLLAPKMKAFVTMPGGTDAPVEGAIEVVSDVVDPERQTVPIRVRVDNRERRLRPNAYVDLTFSAREGSTVVVVPAESVVSDGATSVVFVETAAGVFTRRKVQLGRQTKERAEIVSGLSAGEKVVTSGALLLLNAIDVRG